MITANEVREKMRINNDMNEIMSTLEKWILKAAEENFTGVEALGFVDEFDEKTKNLIVSVLKMNGYEVIRREHSNKRYRSFYIAW